MGVQLGLLPQQQPVQRVPRQQLVQRQRPQRVPQQRPVISAQLRAEPVPVRAGVLWQRFRIWHKPMPPVQRRVLLSRRQQQPDVRMPPELLVASRLVFLLELPVHTRLPPHRQLHLHAVRPWPDLHQRTAQRLPPQFARAPWLQQRVCVRVQPRVLRPERRSMRSVSAKFVLPWRQCDHSMHGARHIARPERERQRLLLRPRIPGRQRRSVQRVSLQHVVLDRHPQHVPVQHLGARSVVVSDQLHLLAWFYGCGWNGLFSMPTWYIQDSQRQFELCSVPCQQLLSSRFRHSHCLPAGQQQLAFWLHLGQPVPVQCWLLWLSVHAVSCGVLLSRRKRIVRMPQQRVHHCRRQLGIPVHVSRQLGRQFLGHLRVCGGIPAHCGWHCSWGVAMWRVPSQLLLHGQ